MTRNRLAADIDGAVTRHMAVLCNKGILETIDAEVVAVIFQAGMVAAMEIMDARGKPGAVPLEAASPPGRAVR